MNKPEKILCAAIHIDDGANYTTNSPENIETGFIEVGQNHAECEIQLIREGKLFLGKRTDGFYTDHQNFYGRKMAFSVALEAKQINPKNTMEYGALYSPDLIN